jgi:uracil-DNA glycosylase family 4
MKYLHSAAPKPTFAEFIADYKKKLAENFGKDRVGPFWGNQNAKIVSISQAPSQSVIINQKPFADKSGDILREAWLDIPKQLFYDPDKFYFTSVGKYFPGKDLHGGDLPPQLHIARTWLTDELSYLKPHLFLVIGRLAANFFFPRKKLAQLVFSDWELNGTLAIVIPHPSPRNLNWHGNVEFTANRIPEVRKHISQALGL